VYIPQQSRSISITTISTKYFHYCKHCTYPLLPGDLFTNNIIYVEYATLCNLSNIFSHNSRIEQEDIRSFAIRELSVESTHFAHGVRTGESVVLGEEVIVRHTYAGLFYLDLRVFYVLKANPAFTMKLFSHQSID